MNSFIRAIYFDLLSRVNNLIQELSSREYHEGIDPGFVERTGNDLKELSRKIVHRIESGDLNSVELHKGNLRRYSALQEKFELIEAYPYQVIIKYQDAEVYLNKKISIIYDEIRCIQDIPLVTTISDFEQYYWAHPLYNIIAVPLGEERNLLNLPDLYHEIAHLIYMHYKDYLLGGFLSELDDYIEEEKNVIDEETIGIAAFNRLEDIHELWIEHWTEEFLCDLIATYLVGEAYGWSNLKITAIQIQDSGIYESFERHPSNEARMRAVFMMLDRLKISATRLKDNWQAFKEIKGMQIPSEYDVTYPDHILEKLTDYVLQGCLDLDLASYTEQQEYKKTTIAETLNDAWEKIQTDANSYDLWQSEVIEGIRNTQSEM